MFGLFKKKTKTYEEIVIQEGGKRCNYCLGHGKIMVTYDGDVEMCPKCNGEKVTKRIVQLRELLK